MKWNRVTSTVLVSSVSVLLGCSSAEQVVSANVLSSNDNEYNPTTLNGRKGGLIKPGIPEGILEPGSATPDKLRAATKVRITLSQEGQTDITREAVPKTYSWQVTVLDEAGEPVLDDKGAPVKEEHLGISQFFERITLSDGWKGEAEARADAVDDEDDVILSASVNFTVEKNGVVYVPIDLKIPSPSTGGAAGASGNGGAAGSAGSAGMSQAGSAGSGGSAGAAQAGNAGSGGSAGAAQAGNAGSGGSAGAAQAGSAGTT